MSVFDSETVDRWRRLGPRATYREIREALYRLGATSSEDFLDAFEEAMERGLLTWDGIEAFERETENEGE
jgi:hypothetical protein